MNRELAASHTYHFNPNHSVNMGDLTDVTLRTLEAYERGYKNNPAGYFERLEGSIRRLPGNQTAERIPYTFLRRNGDSNEEVVVLQNPWGTPITPQSSSEDVAEFVAGGGEAKRPKGLDTNSWGKLIVADLLHESLKEAGITDARGDFLPVVVISSPSVDRRGVSHLWPWRKLALNKDINGLSILGRTMLSVCQEQGFGRLHLSGVSQGGSAVAEALQRAYAYDFDVQSVLLSEMPSYKERGLIDFAKRYMGDLSGLELEEGTAWTDQGPLPRTELAQGGESWDALGNVAGNGNLLVNLHLVNAMRKANSLASVVETARIAELPLTVEYGKQSKVGSGMESALQELEDARSLSLRGLLQVIESDGVAPHAHTEHPLMLSDLNLRSILFARRATKQ